MTTAAAAPEAKPKNEAFLEEARKRFKRAEEAEDFIRDRGKDDLKMRSGDQWDPGIKAQRLLDKRPCHTVNRLPQFIRQVANDQRQNRPAIQVSPVDDKADIETAKIQQGLIRHIEYDSGADAAYDQALEHAATMGLGYFRVITEYSDPMSFDLDIKIKRVRNPFSIYIDPDAKEADRSDMRWAFVVDDMVKDEFEARYPNADVCKEGGSTGWDQARQQAPGWMDGDSVRVAEYFCMSTKKATLCMLADGQTLLEDDLQRLPEGSAPVVVKSRPTEIPTIRWCKIIGTEILEETEWPGIWIPIVPVLGDELEVDGKVILEGVIRHAKDSQKMLNVMVSAETEAIGLAPKAPFIVAEGQIKGREREWKTANTKNHAYLTYTPTSLNGNPVPPPQRNFGEPNIQAITQSRMQHQDDLKALTGIYDSALGQHSNETSGLAIRARQHQSNTANFHLVDNLTRAIRHLGRILLDLMPKVYDVPRVMRIMGEDGESQTVLLNQRHIDPKTKQEVIYDLSAGKYDVTVTAGPSYSTKRQEASASMMQLTQSYPPLAQFAGDLLVRNMDWPGAQEIADRLKKMLPPELQDHEGEEGAPNPALQAAQAKVQQMGQVIERLTQALNEAHDRMDAKEMELASKERIAAMQAQVELLKTWATLDQKDAHVALQAELEQIQQRLLLLGQNQLIEEEHPESQPTASDAPAEPPEAGEVPEFDGLGEPATGAAMPGTYAPGQMPATSHGLPGAYDPGSSMETP